MSKPIIDKAEISIDFPDKFYHGSFGRQSRYGVRVDDEGIHIALDRSGEDKRHVELHLHHHLFSGILTSIAEEISEHAELCGDHREQLKEATAKLAKALRD
jgi:hypothetical protein